MSILEPSILMELWNNPDKKEDFLKLPKDYLTTSNKGFHIDDNTDIVAFEDTANKKHVILPSKKDSQHPLAQASLQAMLNGDKKAHLKNNTKEALSGYGVKVPKNVDVKVLENKDNLLHIVLPHNPAASSLSNAELEATPGGVDACGVVTGVSGIGCGIGAIFSLGVSAGVSGVIAGTSKVASNATG